MQWAELLLAAISGGGATAAGAWLRARLRAPKIEAQARQIEDESQTASWKALLEAAIDRGNALERLISERDGRLSKLTSEITAAIQHRITCETRLQIAETQQERLRAELEQLRINFHELSATLAIYRKARRRPVRDETPREGTSITDPSPAATTGDLGKKENE